MLSAKYLAKTGDARAGLRHITALRLPLSLSIYQQRNRNLIHPDGLLSSDQRVKTCQTYHPSSRLESMDAGCEANGPSS
ncbi:MAG: hypothetical protein JSS04_07925 [Proteobacteria bacterium]|nr:hypothetical protein [Pseudomonadota bacterium]